MLFAKSSALLFVSFLLANVAHAAYFDASVARGQEEKLYQSPRGYTEKCVVTQDLPFGVRDGRKIEKEQKLCSIDMHADDGVGVCPKYESTNPGLNIYDLSKTHNKQDFENNTCNAVKDDYGAKKIAKFKQSVSCSYTPSPIAYYHLTRLLAGPEVPAIVIRTYDYEDHRLKRAQALAVLQKLKDFQNEPIYQTWSGSWNKAITHQRDSIGQTVFTSDLKGIYGSLQDNARGEEKYNEVNGPNKGYDHRFESLTGQPSYQHIIDPRGVEQLTARNFAAAAQLLQQMRDVSSMLILDYITGQNDRPNNIHYKLSYWSMGADGNIQRSKDQVTGAIPVKEMLLKDNDCGIAKGNPTKDRGLLKMLAHIHPETYKGLQHLAQELSANPTAIAEFLKKEWLFTDTDVTNFRTDSIELARTLKARCEAGSLKQDLDLKDFLANQTRSCN
jgi:hypothetical protein